MGVKMNISICTIGLRHKKAEEAFRIIASVGAEYADVLKDGYPHYFGNEYSSSSVPKDMQRIAEIMQRSLLQNIASFAHISARNE